MMSEMREAVKIGLIQMRCEKAAMAQNLAVMSHYLESAANHGLDLVCFPEMSISGYADPNKYPEAILRLNGGEVKSVLNMSRGRLMTIMAGLIEENPKGKPFITQIVVRDGQLLGVYRKLTIKDEEEDWFSPGNEIPVFQHEDLLFSIAICADIGNEDVFSAGAHKGAQLVLELAAPGLYGDQETRDWRSGFKWWENKCSQHLSQYAKTFGVWIGVATQAGRTIDEDFPGGGYLFSPDGSRLFATHDWSPGAAFLNIDLAKRSVEVLAYTRETLC